MDQRIIRIAAGACLAATAGLGLAGCSLLPGGGTATQPTSDQGSNSGTDQGSGSGSTSGSGSSTSGAGTESTAGSDSGSGSAATDEGTMVESLDLRAGDCFNQPEGDQESLGEVAVVDCAAPHSFEVFHTVTVTGDTFPGDSALETQADSECGPRFDSWVADSSKFGYRYAPPSQQTWEQADDRVILCVAAPMDGGQTTGSAGK